MKEAVTEKSYPGRTGWRSQSRCGWSVFPSPDSPCYDSALSLWRIPSSCLSPPSCCSSAETLHRYETMRNGSRLETCPDPCYNLLCKLILPTHGSVYEWLLGWCVYIFICTLVVISTPNTFPPECSSCLTRTQNMSFNRRHRDLIGL